ncbi:DUF4489 domain-containing protein [Anaeromicrobium sediminis]|uniref:Uncharacterized protein n=1 Tax=Anaeromicrobium sediminis TaxID=1478221 RepID=A0A267MPD0_9FIRM|nr:DUF4489 domain-containing protein [Anaeromicrobium sediminis]PAB60745.1 hypothetical protein CCE28_04195 [Anaeromicrobium sediminis]
MYYKEKKEKDCKLILECGKIFDPVLPPRLNDDPNNPMRHSVKLASVTVDTRFLSKACVNVEYSSIINVVSLDPGSDTTITLKFRLTRECRNREKEILQEWEYVEGSLQDDEGEGEAKDAFTVTFCECVDCFHSDCCTYTIELIKAAPSLDNDNVEIVYNITNKNILAIISCENHLQCGKIFNPPLPPRLNDDPSNPMSPPVKLASVTVDTRFLSKPCVNIKYSSIIRTLAASDPTSPDVEITLKFRLIKECKEREKEILEEWEYIQSGLEDEDAERESKDTFTISFCECLDCFDSDCCQYTIELIEAAPTLIIGDNPGVLYDITNKDMSAIVACEDQVKCGQIFNPSLPPRLNDDPNNSIMPPIKLASVTVDTKHIRKPCVNIEYSSVIDTIATIDESLDITLKFRLIRECKNKEKEILEEWEYIQGNLEDEEGERESKDFFTVIFCECLDCCDSDCCTYTMELIEAAPRLINGDIGVLYNITNKNISAIVACENK